MELEENIITNK